LLHGNAKVDQIEILRHGLREIDIDEIRKMDCADHDPDPEPEPFSINGIPAEKASQQERDDSHGAVDDSHL
jgi:hypothetical protein